ncbi:hypothetical protein [Kutzneria chonburiensis]|uniref:Uncharacterized protein n=1 Tax=Kutzneria chonburiensis TaxID=1483604 RepID=A0ABV6MNY1_9PSEU|nr:hypothetical protein [Kutzneria chonburiensis]
MDDRVRLAALRASRTLPMPEDVDELAEVRVAAARAGRRLVETSSRDGAPELALGWQQDNALTPDDPGGPPKPTEGEILALAACLRACWPDPDEPLYPGATALVSDIAAALRPLGISGVTRSLNRLVVLGFVLVDSGTVRLGPDVAFWRDADIASLRREHHQLPAAREQE